MTRLLRWASVVLAVLGVAAMAATVAELGDGIVELPRHWWSTAPVLIVAAAGVLWRVSKRPPAGA